MTDALERHFAKLRRNPKARNVLMAVEAPRKGISWRGTAEHLSPDTPFFIASCTKLFTTALALQLVDAGELDLDRPAAHYLPEGMMDGLHVIDGVDRSRAITMRQLLSNTSGLGDYFEEDWRDGPAIFKRVMAGEDPHWTRAEALDAVRTGIKPKFAPGAPGKAFYSDTNFQLAGAVIEAVNGADYAALIQSRICAPLGLADTYVFGPGDIGRYDGIAPMLKGTQVIALPRTMAAFGPDGGIVSTLGDSIGFLKGFFGGALFAAGWIARMQAWNPVFFPFRYGMGMMRFALPRVFTPLRRIPPVIGHSGASGVVMFWCPEREIFVAGSVNQIESRGLPYQFLLKAVDGLR